MSYVVMALQSTCVVVNLFLSKALQDIWGIINSQIITIHMTLFKCQQTTPATNIGVFNDYLSQLTQKDMYPTDEIYEAVFNFGPIKSEAQRLVIEVFERARSARQS